MSPAREAPRRPRLGLIVNPVAGMGGSVGLKGTDTADILREARARGAVPRAPARARAVLEALAPARERFLLVTGPGAMGETEAREAGLQPLVPPGLESGADDGTCTRAADTRAAARAMAEMGVAPILFAGGDGTARDMVAAIGDRVAVIGIPAGVKMHSAVYATSPRAAAALALRALERNLDSTEREVMDIDEAAFRAGAVSAKLYGYLRVPHAPDLVQNVKAGGVSGERAAISAIAADIAERIAPGHLLVLGPGTTTRAVAEAIGVPKTLLGVDLIRDGRVVGADVSEAEILAALGGGSGCIVVTPIGGQGHFFGRGNQQISARVITRIGVDNVLIVATMQKIASLGDGTLHVDTGDAALDEALGGWRRVVSGYRTETVCRVAA